MINKDTEQKILAEYDANAHTYTILAAKLEQLLREILHERSIQVHTISSRPKSRKSLAGKLNKDGAKYENVVDLTDLVGLRVTTYFAEDVDRIAKVIAEEFDIDLTNSVDKRQDLASDRFGYLSLHHVISLKESRCELTEYKSFKGIKIELQTRSVLQHAWAEIEHDLGYKSEIEVPQHIRRRFALVAGLLELADREFDGIKKELESYREELTVAVQASPEYVSLNLDSVRALVNRESLIYEISQKIRSQSTWQYIEKMDIDAELLLRRSRQMGIKTVDMLLERLRSQEELILLFAHRWEETRLPKDGKEAIASGVSAYYLWLLWLSNDDEETMHRKLVEGGHTTPDLAVRRIVVAEANAKKDLIEANKSKAA